MTATEEPPKQQARPLSIEEILNAGNTVIKRELAIDGQLFYVEFRRLTYGEILNLEKIPSEEPGRYVKVVVFLASQQPKFETVDDVPKALTGFIRNYATLIMEESGKDPFLLTG